MKKLIVILAVLLTASMSQAANISVREAPTGAYTSSYVLLSSVTATGAGTSYSFAPGGGDAFGIVPIASHTCTSTWNGTAPTNIVFNIECSEDGTNFGTCAAVTMTASPTITHIADKPIRYIRGNYVSKSGGSTDTKLTLTCTSGGI